MVEASIKGLPKNILFSCGQNCVRSPMAAALMRHFYGSQVEVFSAGFLSGMPDGFVVAVMGEIGIDLNDHEPKTFDDLSETDFEVNIVLASQALERATALGTTRGDAPEYWPTPDPTEATGNREQRLEAYRAVRDFLLKKIKERFGAPIQA